MTEQLRLDDDVPVREYDYGDEVVYAADVGVTADASVDVVDDTVIVVTDNDQFEIEAEGDAQAFIHNGVLTIEVDE